jgi:hypothetical protein
VCGASFGLWSRHLDNDVDGQVGLIMLIGLSAKNAILIVEFAKAELEKGQSVVAAALNGARVRLRPILMTSFAFIFGLYPLWNALGAGGEARRLIGTVTITGMLFSTAFAIFLIPILFVVVERIANRIQGIGLSLREQQKLSHPNHRLKLPVVAPRHDFVNDTRGIRLFRGLTKEHRVHTRPWLAGVTLAAHYW